ncbi:hypothetical protein [Paenibacillus alvei]|uniref:hypothetical protein n=1 Tax=Paenibacillus alvei TaxID=44250 RepID=UPI0015802F1E|nr:hypothetical protein [Paenibacillus alvei]
MKLNKLLSCAMVLSLSLFSVAPAFAADKGTESVRVQDSVKVNTSLEGRGVDVITLKEGKLESFDENGVKTTTFLTKEQLAHYTQLSTGSGDEFGTMSYNTELIPVYVPRNIDGNQGAVVQQYGVVAPHTRANLYVAALPTTMPTINVSFSNGLDDTSYWYANARQGQLITYKVKYPRDTYTTRVSTAELNGGNAMLRAFTD